MPVSTQSIASCIQAARKRKLLTQRELSKRTNIPQSHISKIERGAVDLHISSLVTLARSLDLEMMLVPRNLVAAVQALQEPGLESQEEQIPLYRLKPEGAQDG